MTEKKKRKPTSRTAGELLNESESKRFYALLETYKLDNSYVAKMTGTKFPNTVATWIASKKIPAKCRALLELLELKDKIKV